MLNKKNNYFENKLCPKNCSGDCEECQKIIDERDALAVIIEKDVDVSVLKLYFRLDEEEALESYNLFHHALTREEFNLLKKMFVNKDQASSETKDEEQISPLEALERLSRTINNHIETHKYNYVDYDVVIIRNALKRTNELESRLNNLRKAFDSLSKKNEKAMKELSLEIEKNRAFEIIVKKNVDIVMLKAINDFTTYNEHRIPNEIKCCIGSRDYMLTKEEFDLLKEVIGCKN